MAYAVEFTEQARRLLRGLPADVQPRLLKKLEANVALATDPRATGMELVSSDPELWCYQIGAFRVACQIDDGNEILVILNIRRSMSGGHP